MVTPKDLADLMQRLLEQQVAVNTKPDKQTVDPEVQKLADYLNEIGAPRLVDGSRLLAICSEGCEGLELR